MRAALLRKNACVPPTEREVAMHTSILSSRATSRVSVQDWDDQWTAPSSRLEQLAPWLALGVAALLSLW